MEKKMPYITTAESIGLEKGLKKGREEGLQKGREEGLREGAILGLREAIDLGLKLKFGTEGVMLRPEIGKIDEVERLRSIKEAIEIAHDLEEIKKILKN